MDQSALLTDSRQINFYIIIGLSRKSSSSRNIAMQQQGARKYGCFHGLHGAKLQSNAWGMLGGEMGRYGDRVLADSVNQFSAMGCPSYERSQQQPLSSVPKVVIVERFKCI